MKHLIRAGKFLGPYRWLVVGALLSLAIANGASLIQPQFARLIMDRGIAEKNMVLVLWMALAMVGFAALRAVFSFLRW